MISNNRGVISVFLLIVLTGFFQVTVSLNDYLLKSKARQIFHLHTENVKEWSKNNYSSYLKDHYGLMAVPVNKSFVEILRNHGRIETGFKPDINLTNQVHLEGVVLLEQLLDVTKKTLPVKLIKNAVDWKQLISDSKTIKATLTKKNKLDRKLEAIKIDLSKDVLGETKLKQLKSLKEDYQKIHRELEQNQEVFIQMEGVKDQLRQAMKWIDALENDEPLAEVASELAVHLPKESTFKEKIFGKTIADMTDKRSVQVSVTDALIMDAYILSVFKTPYPYHSLDLSFNNREERKGVLEGEIEFILVGGHSDKHNITMVKLEMIGLRSLLNLLALLSDKEIMTVVNSASSTGPAGMVASYAVLASYVIYESNEDYKVLIEGEAVPLIKARQDFHFQLVKSEAVRSSVGLYYGDYLRGLLTFVEGGTKLNRIEHLIVSNYKKMVKDQEVAFVTTFDLNMDYKGLEKRVTVDVLE